MTSPECKDTRRISVDLPNQLIDRFDQLKREWGLKKRGLVLERLLEYVLTDEQELDFVYERKKVLGHNQYFI